MIVATPTRVIGPTTLTSQVIATSGVVPSSLIPGTLLIVIVGVSAPSIKNTARQTQRRDHSECSDSIKTYSSTCSVQISKISATT